MKYTVYPSLVLIQIVLFCLVLMPFISSIRYKNRQLYYKESRNYRNCIILLGLLFCVFGSYDGDWYHYITVVADNYRSTNPITHIESIHKWIIRYLSFGNYIWWRFIIWGGTYWLIWLSLKRINQNDVVTWTCVLAIGMIPMSIGRGYIGIALLFYGMVCVLKPKVKGWSMIKGLGLMLISLFFHKSMFIYFLASTLALYRYRKIFLGISIILLPIFIKIFTKILVMLLLADELGRSAEGYLNDVTKDRGIGRNLYEISFNLLLFLVFILYFLGNRKKRINNNCLTDCLWRNTYNLYYGFCIIWSALTLNHIGNNDISNRILWGLYLPVSILLSCMLKQGYKLKLNILFILGFFIAGLYRLMYAFYLQKLGTGV